MGYQESLRPIGHLAESAGIKRAIDDYADNPHIPEYCHYYCSTRARGGSQLYACIGGQRCRVHIVAGIDWDWAIPPDAKYSDYYEDLDESLVEAAAKERPDLAEKAYQEVAAALKGPSSKGSSGREGSVKRRTSFGPRWQRRSWNVVLLRRG